MTELSLPLPWPLSLSFPIFPLPCPAGQDRDRLAFLGIWCPARMVHMHPCNKAWECHRASRKWQRLFLYNSLQHSVGGNVQTVEHSQRQTVKIFEWEMIVSNLHSILNEIPSWKRKHCVSVQHLHLVLSVGTGREYQGLFPEFSYIQERKMKELRVSNFSYRAFTKLIRPPSEKEGRSLGSFFLPLNSGRPTGHFWSLCFFFHLFSAGNLNFPASPCSFSDVH